MAGMLGACGRPCLVRSCGRHLRNTAWLGRGEQASFPSFRMRPVVQPRGWQSPAIQQVLPRWLGISAPSQRVREETPAESPKDFRLIYRFPGIRYCRALSRLKLLQTAFTVLVLPPIWFLHWQDQVTQAQCLYSTGIACFAGFMLYAMSYFFRRIVGLMYLKRDGTVLRVAHLTFWGRRREVDCPIETVMTLDDAGGDRNELLLCLKRYGEGQFFYFTLRFGQVVDEEGFLRVFGRV
ncbi:PREDICTED: transmembrane protein 186 [Gekko japonicus]|uniref:Transmembrane protein 186 n=1 Tax=Gekko japonicus TaxID=146911 RepID=A0ABM1KH64_GEKJA|nr:PREDICTED: transmembrane protein 186 [Gekko japonicus]